MSVIGESGAIVIGENQVAWRDVVAVARHHATIALSESSWSKVSEARRFVEEVAAGSELCYGINSGLGALCNVKLNKDELQNLSFHTLMSHACGVGDALSHEQVRAIMCVAVVNYSHGCSGVSLTVIEGLISFLNNGVTPIVPAKGSVGYLTHMAHIGLTLIGVGEVSYRGEKLPSTTALQCIGMQPVKLGPKDGLCLVNGTPGMTGLACLCLEDTAQIGTWADIISAMSFEALNGQVTALQMSVTSLKLHPGMQQTASNLNNFIQGSKHLASCQGQHLQDALSVRAIPHVHGACRDQFYHAAEQINRELNSVSDNPLVLNEGDGYKVCSQAHAHGVSVSMACDLLAIAVCEWSSIAERRVHRLVNPAVNKLPAFLTHGSGVKSGMMIAQYTAASLAADNKRLASPAVVDNYITSGFQEDHLSFGESSALKLSLATNNAFYILAIEYMMAAQAFDLLESEKFGKGTTMAWRQLREYVGVYDESRPLHKDIEATCSVLKGEVLSVIKNEFSCVVY